MIRAGNSDGFRGEPLDLEAMGQIGSRKKSRSSSSKRDTAIITSTATGVLMATAMGKKLFQPPALCDPMRNALRARALCNHKLFYEWHW